jgi:hypothetical protein
MPRVSHVGRSGLSSVGDFMAHHGVMAVDELDELYTVKPEEFTALRTDLAAAAKKRGDAAAAKRISAARRPTTAAWVVNRLVGSNDDVKRSLTNLGERLRGAHAAMDGAAIRELSAEQRSLVEELARAAFDGADIANPSASVREDVISTLQAAVADPDVAERLGRLAKAEQWSGFGDFGATTAVLTSARGHDRSKPARPSQRPSDERQRDKGRRPSEDAMDAKDAKDAKETAERKAALAAAERAKDDADNALSDRQSDLAVARLRRDEMRKRLSDAEGALAAAEGAYAEAKQASRDAAETVRDAKARLTQSRRAR